jgi:hypothetical protein
MKTTIWELPSTQRRWRDLKTWRLFLGLVAAPVPSVLLGILLLILVDQPLMPSQAFIVTGVILLVTIVWSLLVGWSYLLIVTRRRAVLSRTGCFFLGIAAAITLPAIAESVSIVVDAFTIGSDYAFAEPWGSDASTRVLGAMLSVALAPFGLLGGWIFWRLAVRPAVTTLGDAAPVFD